MHTLRTPLPEALARVLIARGYDELTPVQRAVLDVRPDVDTLLVSSRTGSGKTLAFGLMLGRALIADRVEASRSPRALVLSPTRELAAQIVQELTGLLSQTDLRVVACIGGQDPAAELRLVRGGADVLVASPGRLKDHVSRGKVQLHGVTWIVLDEADELLQRGFRNDVEMLLQRVAPIRKTLFLTATLTPEIERFAQASPGHRFKIDLNDDAPAARASAQVAYLVSDRDKDRGLVNVLRYHDPDCALVFCGRRDRAADLCGWLKRRGFEASCLSGALPQAERTRTVERLRTGRARICVATDLASRGIDIPAIDLVVHADPPANAQALIHRSGRTGRAKRAGRAIFLATPKQRARLVTLARTAGFTLAWSPVPQPSDILALDLHRMLRDPLFTPPTCEQDRAMSAALMQAHSPEAIASACGRLWLGSRPGVDGVRGT